MRVSLCGPTRSANERRCIAASPGALMPKLAHGRWHANLLQPEPARDDEIAEWHRRARAEMSKAAPRFLPLVTKFFEESKAGAGGSGRLRA